MNAELLAELKRLLETEFAQTGFRKSPASPELYVPPAVHLYALPARRAHPKGQEATEIKEEFPFIVLRPVSGQDEDEAALAARVSSVDIWFLCGVFTAGDAADGARDLEAMMGRIRRMLLRRRLYLKLWERQLPVNWEVGDGVDHAQPHPYHGGSVRVKFQAPAPAELLEIEEEVIVYGQLES